MRDRINPLEGVPSDLPDELPIGKALRETRERNRLTQIELARRTGIDPITINAIELGRIKNPSFRNLQTIARCLNVKVSQLLGRAEGELKIHFFVGSQAGEFSLDYSKNGFRVISYTPRCAEVFCGKVILGGKRQMDSEMFALPCLAFIQILLGKAQVHVDGRDCFLKEGQSLLFDGRLGFQFLNPSLRDTVFLLFTAPSFLSAIESESVKA